jgi:hypothetical protein
MSIYTKLDIMPIQESDTYISVIKLKTLIRCAKITSKAENEEYYQREIDPAKIKKIVAHIEEKIFTNKNREILFPTPLILGIRTNTSLDEQNEKTIKAFMKDYETKLKDKELEDTEQEECHVINREEKKAYIHHLKQTIMIVDGQHRFVAAKKMLENHIDIIKNIRTAMAQLSLRLGELVEENPHRETTLEAIKKLKELSKGTKIRIKKLLNLELGTVILNNYSLDEQAKVFLDVNLNQKAVNKALNYQIFGTINDAKSYIAFAYDLTEALGKKTIFMNILKRANAKGGVISFAFMVDTIVKKLICEPNGKLLTLYGDYLNGEEGEYTKLPSQLEQYLTTLKGIFGKSYYPDIIDKNYKSCFLKTTGMYSWLMLFGEYYQEYIKQDKYSELGELFSGKIENPEAFFGEKSMFSSAGSAGLQSRLYNALKTMLGLNRKELVELIEQKLEKAKELDKAQLEWTMSLVQNPKATQKNYMESAKTLNENIKDGKLNKSIVGPVATKLEQIVTSYDTIKQAYRTIGKEYQD